MTAALSFGHVDPSPGAGDKAPTPESPFRIAVLGDFSGRAERGDLAERKAHRLDRENFENILAKLNPELELPLPDDKGTATLSFRTLDDFLPDEIYSKVDAFEDCYDADEKTALMNALLHHPSMQQLEAAWRGVDWLTKRILKQDTRIEVLLYDISFDELQADLMAQDDLGKSALHQLLIEKATQGPKGEAWGLLCGNYLFDATAEHMTVLGRMAKIARQASVSFFTGAHPRLHESAYQMDEETREQWTALRALPEANLLGLALPRFLLRLPYGERTKSIDRFEYEELKPPIETSGYLWGNAMWACVSLLGMGFNKQGWAFKPGGILDIESLPVHVYTWDDDEQIVVAESWLNKPIVERLGKQGLMPLLPVKGKDALQILRFQSLAPPPKGAPGSELLGRWGQAGMVQLPRSAKPGFSTTTAVIGGDTASAAAPAHKPPPGAPTPAAAAEDEAPPMDPELAALLAQAEAPAAAPPEDEAPPMDPELAALLAQMDAGGAADAPAEPPAEDAMDPELAALLAQMDAGGADAAPPAEPPAEEDVDPELAALLAQMEAGAPAEPDAADTEAPAAAAAEEDVDPELAALLAQMEAGAPDEAAPAAEEAAPAPSAAPADDVDPELAALLAEMEQTPSEAAEPTALPVAAAATAAEEDPELAALLAEMEATAADEVPPPAEAAEAAPPEPPASSAEDEDPELAALLAEMEQSASAEAEQPTPAATEPTAPAPAAEEADPELAALLAEMEATASAEAAAPAVSAAEVPPTEPAAEAMDPELAALLAEMEGTPPEDAPAAANEEPAAEADTDLAALMAQLEAAEAAENAPEAEAEPEPSEEEKQNDLRNRVNELGSHSALADLGWPLFVPAFREDYARQIAILEKEQKNQGAVKEVAALVKALGGYSVLADYGISKDQGLNTQLEKLHEFQTARTRTETLRDPELAAMARNYGANLKPLTNDEDKYQLLLKIKDYDQWASDPRHLDIASALDGTKFAERRKAQLEQQLQTLGGEKAVKEAVAISPAHGFGKLTLEDKVALLKMYRELTKLGGEQAYQQEAAGSSPAEDVRNKLAQLKAIRAAR